MLRKVSKSNNVMHFDEECNFEFLNPDLFCSVLFCYYVKLWHVSLIVP